MVITEELGDELIGVGSRNSWHIRINFLTEEEFRDTCNIIKNLFDKKGYKYIQESNKLFKEKIEEQKKSVLLEENKALKEKIAEKEALAVPKTLGNKGV